VAFYVSPGPTRIDFWASKTQLETNGFHLSVQWCTEQHIFFESLPLTGCEDKGVLKGEIPSSPSEN
jgi:hypothetical protein